MIEEFEFDVFLAHNSSDKNEIRAISDKLKQRGLKVWLDEDQLLGGDGNLEGIQNGLSNSKCAVFFIGNSGTGRWQGGLELQIIADLVIEKERKLIPVLLPGISEIPNTSEYSFIRTKARISFTGTEDNISLTRLEESIRKDTPKIYRKTSGSSSKGEHLKKTRTLNRQDYLPQIIAPASQTKELYCFSIRPDDYHQIIDAYMKCCVLSKEIDTITKIFRQLSFKEEKIFDHYLISLETAKVTLSAIPEFNRSQPDWMTRVSSAYVRETKKYKKSYTEIKKFVVEELDLNYDQNYSLNHNRQRISSLTVYNNDLEQFWGKLYKDYTPQLA